MGEGDVAIYWFRILGCVQVLVIFAAAGAAAFVAAKAKTQGLRAAGPVVVASSLVVSALNGVFFTLLDWLDVGSDLFYPLTVVGMGVEVLIAVAFVIGLALLGRAPAPKTAAAGSS